jgi:phosphoglycerate dehydrogenase-like enzyme
MTTASNSMIERGNPLTVAMDTASIDEVDATGLAEQFPDVQFAFADTAADLATAIAKSDVVFGKRLPYESIVGAPRVRWVQAGTAGVDALLSRGPWPSRVTLTNARGAHGTPMAEQVIAMMLAFATRLHVLLRAQGAEANVARAVAGTKWNLAGQTVMVLGLGDIGESVAIRAAALGLRVTGVRRTPVATNGCAHVVGQHEFRAYLAHIDHLVACLPLTPETHHLIGERELLALPRGAHVYNVGRGAVIDGTALRRALADGHVGGAGLDCVEPADVPAPGDPLWSHPDVILGQHTSGHSPGNSRAITAIFSENLRRFIAGDALRNVVDPGRGY